MDPITSQNTQTGTPDNTEIYPNPNVSSSSHASLNAGSSSVASETPSAGAPQSNVSLPKTGSQYFNNSIFWIEIEKIVPNPYQPRREFDPHALKDLSESIRMYGLLQPLVVTRREIIKEDGGLVVQYELISGERRLRASKLGGLIQVPVIIRAGEEDARVKLELAIIENLQREDLNAVDRARSFQRLADEFGLKHVQIAEKMGKSREYVTNSIRLLSLPEHMLAALSEKKITEGHTRPLLMLVGRPEEQETLFKEIVFKKITVREAESIARRVAVERTRKKDLNAPDPEIREFETKLNQALGTRVMIEKREQGGKVVIDFFSNQDLRHLLDMLERRDATHDDQGIPEALKPLFNSMPEYVAGSGTSVAASASAVNTNAVSGNAIGASTGEAHAISSDSSVAGAQHAVVVDVPSIAHSAPFDISAEAVADNASSFMDHDAAGETETARAESSDASVFDINNALSSDFGQMGSMSVQNPTISYAGNHANPASGEYVAEEHADDGSLGTTDHGQANMQNAAQPYGQNFDHAQFQPQEQVPVDDSTPSDAQEDENLYSIKNFSI